MFRRTDRHTGGKAQSNMLLQLFQSWGHKKRIVLSKQNVRVLFVLNHGSQSRLRAKKKKRKLIASLLDSSYRE